MSTNILYGVGCAEGACVSVSKSTCIPVLKGLGASSPIFVVVVEGAGVALSTQPRWTLARLCLVVGQHKA